MKPARKCIREKAGKPFHSIRRHGLGANCIHPSRRPGALQRAIILN